MKKRMLSLLIAICLVIGMIPAVGAAGIEDYPVLEYNVDLTINCDGENDTYVTFTPEVTDWYMFDCTAEYDAVGVLYTADFSEELASDAGYSCAYTEHRHTPGSFCLNARLEGGTTYILGVRTWSKCEVIVRGGCQHFYNVQSTVDATCCEDGARYYTCFHCGKNISRIIQAHPYYETEVIQEPTCCEPGVKHLTCDVCGRVKTEPIPTIHHAYDEALKCIYCGQELPDSDVWYREDGSYLTWSFDNGVLTITGEGEMPNVALDHDTWGDNLWIPNTPWLTLPVTEVVVGNGITTVSPGAFKGSEKLEKVTLSETVTYIGQQAFENCVSLTDITFPQGLEYIGRQAFHFCAALTEVRFPDGLKEIGHDSFRGCDLREVILPAGLENELDDAYGSICETFSENPKLTRFVISEENAFLATDSQGALYTKDMTELLILPEGFCGTYTLPAAVAYFEPYYTFHNCAGLEAIEVEYGNETYYSVDGILYATAYDFEYDEELDDWVSMEVGEKLVCCPPAKNLGAFTIGSDIARLSDWAFKNCRYLTELTVPASCVIDEYTPLGTYITDCTALQAVWFEEGHPVYVSDDEGVVFNRNEFWDGASERSYGPMTCLEYLPAGRTGYYAVPEGVRYLAERSIWNSRLSAIRFPDSLEAYGENAMDKGTIEWILFTGEQPMLANYYDGCESWTEMTAKIYYPSWLESWAAPGLPAQGNENLTYIPYEQGKEPVWGEEEPEKPENPFTDVPVGSFYAEPVAWAVEKNITTGASANSFNPDGQCLRAHVVTFLWRAEGCPEPKSLSNPFVDVKETDFYFKAVLWAVENKITNGSDATHFNPFGVCNRAQVVTFLHRAKGSPAPASLELPFTDVPAGTWYAEPIAWAVEKNITNGLSATQFGPNSPCNRAQVVTFLYRAYH